MNPRAYANQYRQTAINSAVLNASPHRLVALQLAGARDRLRRAVACIELGDMGRKGKAIGEVCALVGNLQASLDFQAGGELAESLSTLYDYMQRRLVEANVANDTRILLEVDGLLGDIESAWNAIAGEQAQ